MDYDENLLAAFYTSILDVEKTPGSTSPIRGLVLAGVVERATAAFDRAQRLAEPAYASGRFITIFRSVVQHIAFSTQTPVAAARLRAGV